MATTRNAERLAREIADLRRRLEGLERSASADLRSVDGGTLTIYDEDGEVRQKVGEQTDGTFTVVDLNAPPPPVPASPIAQGRAGVAVVSSYGLRADGVADWPADFQKIEVHVSATSGFVPSLATKVGEFALDGGSLTVALDAGTYFFVLLAVNTSGRISDPSGEVSAEVLEAATSGGAGGGVKTYHTNDEPVGLDAEDDGALWYDTDRDNLQHRWSGGLLEWVPLLVGGEALASDAVDGKTITGALIRTAESGERIEIASGYDGTVKFFTGHPDEDPAIPGGIRTNSFDSVSGENGSILLMDMSAPRHAGSTKAPAHLEVREQETAPGSGVFERMAIAAADRFQVQASSVELGTDATPATTVMTGGANVRGPLDVQDYAVVRGATYLQGQVFQGAEPILRPVYSQRYNSITQGIPKGTWTRVAFNANDETTNVGFSAGGLWTIWDPGVYFLVGSIAWARDVTNRREIRWVKGGGTKIANSTVPATALDANDATHTVYATARFSRNETVYLEAWQNSNQDPMPLENGGTLTWASLTKIGL